MLKIPNSRKLNHSDVKTLLTASSLKCIESKAGFLDRGGTYFEIKEDKARIQLKVKPDYLEFSLKDPWWVNLLPIIIYVFSPKLFQGALILLGWLIVFRAYYEVTKPKIEIISTPVLDVLGIQKEI
jgi:hypothetical protein